MLSNFHPNISHLCIIIIFPLPSTRDRGQLRGQTSTTFPQAATGRCTFDRRDTLHSWAGVGLLGYNRGGRILMQLRVSGSSAKGHPWVSICIKTIFQSRGRISHFSIGESQQAIPSKRHLDIYTLFSGGNGGPLIWTRKMVIFKVGCKISDLNLTAFQSELLKS